MTLIRIAESMDGSGCKVGLIYYAGGAVRVKGKYEVDP